MSSSSQPEANINHHKLRQRYEAALKSFATSSDTFQILYTASKSSSPQSPSQSSPLQDLKTLYILDSSFNPPTRAHFTLARNALHNDQGPHSARMLFLLATENADKKPKPALFEDRLVMISMLAQRLAHDPSASQIEVDVGVTKKPFFMDKAASIDDSGIYGPSTQQVHLTGFDTIVRIFNPKYYPPEEGLRVLEPFLARHRLRVCYREGQGEERAEQERYVEGIGDGSREAEGMRREWRGRVELVDDAAEVSGVSSTGARRAAVEGRREDLEGLLGEEVAGFVLERGLYGDEEAVKKEGIEPRD